MLFYDFEVFKHDWLVVAIDPVMKKEFVIVNSKAELEQLYNNYRNDIWVGYNSRNYDQYILKAILAGFNPKEVNDWIIKDGKKGWEFSSMLFKIKLNNFDIQPNPPVSLKTLEAFMGVNIHETSVPFNIDRKLTESEIQETVNYCRFDVLNTIEVFMQRKSEFDAQLDLLKAFNLSLNYIGKTQAQLAAVIFDAKKQRYKDEWEIRLPDNLELGKYAFIGEWFLNPDNHWYERKVPNAKGKLVRQVCYLECEIAGLTHTVAWGGIHGGGKVMVTCAGDEVIYDVDAGQLYPNIMRHYNLLSRSARKPKMLDYILDTSMRLKAEGKKKEREPYKRQCNIVYGASGAEDNPLYDPLHRNLVCVYGQVFIIDLLEKLEDIITLLNSNTDGVYFKVKKKDIPELNRRVALWEERTKLKMEFDEFTGMYQGDVNSYVAVQPNGKIKGKGAYLKDLSPLDYDLPIVNEAMRNYLVHGIPVEKTILGCNELIKFQKVVKLSSKYRWVEHECDGKRVEFDNKCYRVFASNAPGDGRIYKCDGVRNPAKFGNTPDRCFILNDDVRGAKTDRFPKLDKSYYIDLAKKRLAEKFQVIV